MKIAVLFGSFNPMTNAHISMLKAAVEELNADKGLFVATNGQYLKRKTVKINDAFYLSEDERREIIERACEGEDKLSFATFELGGINPSRFKTLCKLQKQYTNNILNKQIKNDVQGDYIYESNRNSQENRRPRTRRHSQRDKKNNAYPRGHPLQTTLTQFDRFCAAVHNVYKRTTVE